MGPPPKELPACRPTHRRRPRTRTAEVAARRRIEKFSPDSDVTVERGELLLRVGDEFYPLSRAEARRLRDRLGDALTRTEEFVYTTGEHRADGSYVVARRAADSAGHRKVFDSFDRVERLYEGLPEEFTAEEVGRTGLTGGRRHMLVRHLVEHPTFDCELASRQPLTWRKL